MKFDDFLDLVKSMGIGGFLGTIVIYLVAEVAFGMSMDSTFALIASFMISAFITLLFSLEKYKCTKCRKLFSMEEMKRDFIGETIISRDVTVPETRTYEINKKVHVVHETRTEREYAEANVYKCREKCKHCGYERTVRKITPR